MSFGGAVSAMITSLKSNSRRKTLSHFDGKGMKSNSSNEKFDKLLKRKATPEQLAEIRKKVKVRQRKVLLKTTILTIVLLTVMYFGIKFLLQ